MDTFQGEHGSDYFLESNWDSGSIHAELWSYHDRMSRRVSKTNADGKLISLVRIDDYCQTLKEAGNVNMPFFSCISRPLPFKKVKDEVMRIDELKNKDDRVVLLWTIS